MSRIATTRILHADDQVSTRGHIRPWLWPLPRLDGVAPCVVAPTANLASDDVELCYPGRSASPVLVPVFAAQEGIITYAGNAADTPTICIDHAGGWSTQYAGLAHVLTRPTDRFRRRRKERVRAGDVIGHAPRSSLRIRFSLSRWSDGGCVVVDPRARMHTWSALPWFTEPAPGIAAHAAV